MCGSLRLEKQDRVVKNGGIIPGFEIRGVDSKSGYKWNGFARTDGSRDGSKTLAQQWGSDWKVTYVRVKGYTEGKYNFSASRLGAIVNSKDKEIRILTKPSKTEKEILAHHRAPSRIPKEMTLKDYTRELSQISGGFMTSVDE